MEHISSNDSFLHPVADYLRAQHMPYHQSIDNNMDVMLTDMREYAVDDGNGDHKTDTAPHTNQRHMKNVYRHFDSERNNW